MKKRKIFIISLSILGFWAVFLLTLSATAQDLSNISYPIAELGNCASRAECKIFCDQPANYLACSQWAAKNNLISEKELKAVEREVEQMEKFESGAISEGPGGCKTPEECDAYCQKPEHAEECFKFGVEHNLISLKEAEQIQKQLKEMRGPGECKTREDCDTFCAQPENLEICINYAVKEGTLQVEEIREVMEIMERERLRKESIIPREPELPHFKPKEPEINKEKAVKILEKEKGPGGCSTLEECKEYCSDLSHAEECFSFAEKHGLVAPKDLEKIRIMTKVMKEKGGPGGCKNQKECDEYCALPEHQDECLEFAQKHNLVSPQEVKMMKMAGGGPGGCKNQKECDAYCSKPEHMEECLMFSVRQGFMTEEEAQRMIEIMKIQEQRGKRLRGAPPKEKIGPTIPPMFEKGMPAERKWPDLREGFGPQEMPPPEVMPPKGEMPPSSGIPPVRMPPRELMRGPGGCQTPEECEAYCAKPEHAEECRKFQGGLPEDQKPAEGQMMFPPPEREMPPPEREMPPPEREMPPPEEESQSFFKQIKNFLASILLPHLFK